MPYGWPGPSLQLTGQADFWHPQVPLAQTSPALWTAPVILEVLIPGRMQSHASTAEVGFHRSTDACAAAPARGLGVGSMEGKSVDSTFDPSNISYANEIPGSQPGSH